MRSICIIFLFLSPSIIFCQDNIQFDRLETAKGLQNRSITTIIQDDLGFLWFGSQDGLIRYDGYDIRVFKTNVKNNNSISDNNIRAIAKDTVGNLWIATQGGGLDKFNLKTETFTHYKSNPANENSLSGNAVWSLLVDSKGIVWAGTFSNGLNRLDTKTGEIIRIRENSYAPVYAIAEDTNGMIWFSSQGLNRIDPADLSIENFPASDNLPVSISNGGIRSLLYDRNTDKLWVGVENGGLLQFDPSKKAFIRSTGESQAAINSIYTLHQDLTGRIWAGGNEGAAVISAGDFTLYRHNASDKYSLSTNSVRTIYSDNFGTTWIGTEGGGVNRVLRKKGFQLFRHTSDPASLSFNVIRSLYEDRDGRIWVGTQGGGLNEFDRSTSTFRTVKINSREISSMYQDTDGSYWVGSWGSGLFHLNPQTGVAVNFKRDQNEESLPDDRIQVVHRDKQGVLWVGTENGLATFDGENEWRHFSKPNFPMGLIGNNIQGQAFVESPDGAIWIGTWFGLNKISPDRQIVSVITSDTTAQYLSSEHVISLYLDSAQAVMWIGTFGGGLNRLNITTGNITHFTEDAGLPNNTIYSIKPDNEGNLWVSTNNGLSKFNPQTKKFRNYDATEGLQGNEFYWGAGCRTRDGKLLFGGVNGLNYFDPSAIKDNVQVPPVVITNFELFNKTVSVGAGSVLQQNINFIPELSLNYDQNVLTFQYAALNYNSTEKNLYAYYLENFDKDWNDVGTKRTISYTNLNPGEYILHIKGSNNDGVWNERGISLKVIVIPPFWKTWWFYSLVAIAAFGMVYAILKVRLRSVRRDKEMVRRTLQEALDKAHDELDREKKAVLDEQSKNLQRNWIDQSLSIVSEILSKSKNNVDELSARILSALVKRCEVVAGAIYIYNEDLDELIKRANFGFTQVRSSISAGSGQIGECFRKKEVILIDNLPSNYFNVTSGLGHAVPKSLLLVPLQFEEICVGVIELASFTEIPDYRRQFIETLSAQLTATIHTTQIADRTAKLLEESRVQTEELKVREEELRQNLEEMQTIQEDYSRKTLEYEATIEELRKGTRGVLR